MADRPGGAGELSRVPGLEYLAVAFHAGVTRFAGGFIGVDVFFVLPGFLTSALD